jgi:phosphoesterase RecJ-like protein
MPDKFRYLPEAGVLTPPAAGKITVDALVALDTSVKNRLGTVLESVNAPALIVNMDHHVSNERFGTLNYVDSSAPATGEIVFDFFEDQKIPITPAIAGNLFAAISTDTGSFQYPNTTARTFHVAAELVRRGVNVGQLSKEIYDTMPKRRIELLRHALNSATFRCDDRVASFRLTRQVSEDLHLLPEDNEGIIDHLRAVDTVIAAVFFEELGGGKIRVSARSKDPRVDVCKVCMKFGGGGHPLAAGARMAGAIEEVEAKFLEAVCDEVTHCH